MIKNIAILRNCSVVDKRKSPDYDVLRGLVPIELIRRFKIFCMDNNLDNSEGLEKILNDYFTEPSKKDEILTKQVQTIAEIVKEEK